MILFLTLNRYYKLEENLPKMFIERNNVIKSERDFLLDFFGKEKNAPLLIFSHGFKGFKDWGLFNEIAQYFTTHGFSFAKYNFSHNGTTLEYPTEFRDLDSFGQNNYSKELNDLDLVIDYLTSQEQFKPFINSSNLYLIGHSRGGAISILKAAEDARITKLITWSAPLDFSNKFNSDIKKWKKEGVIYVINGRTKQNMPLYYQFYEDFIINKKRLDVCSMTKKLDIPHLIIHAENDKAVSIDDALMLHTLSHKSILKKIRKSGHTFDVMHPSETSSFPLALQEVLNASINFLKS